MSKEKLTSNSEALVRSNSLSDGDFREERSPPIAGKNQQKEVKDNLDISQKKINRSKLEDAINLSHLEALKQKFMEYDQDYSNGLDMDEFEQVFLAILTRNQDISKEEMKVMFMKIDTNCDGTVDWDEFCTYMLLEYKERQDMNYVNETPFPNPFRYISNSHRETIVGMGFLQALNRRGKDEESTITYSKTNGRYVTVDISGTLSLWNTDMQLQKSFVLDEVRSSRGKKGKLILALECMSNMSKIVVSTTNRELCFYDISSANYDLCFVVPGFENTITCLNYWFNPEQHNEAVLVFGDSLGQVGRLIFSSVQQGLFGADTIKKSNVTRRIMMHDITMGRINGVQLLMQKLHSDWTKKVLFVPHYDGFISCSMDPETSLYFGNIHHTGEKKASSSSSVYKGVNAIDFSKDYIVSGGLDTVIRVWHYSMTNKPTTMMKGHSATVEHVMVSEVTNSIISVSKDTVIKVWDLKDHVCLQTLSKLTFGQHSVTSAYFHSLHHTLIIGSKNFNLGVLERTRKSIVNNSNIKSHQKSVRAALYNHNFNQVVSTSYDSMVCVWDLDTGEKVIQFSHCHGDHEITAMTFDPTHRRLLTAAKDGSIKIWNFNNGALLGELQNVHSEEVTDILCCKNTFITGGWSRQIVIYSDSRGIEEEEPPRIITDSHHTEDILSIALYRSDIIAYSMYDGTIMVRNCGCEIVLCRLSASNCNSTGQGYARIYYSPLANTFPADNAPYSDVPVLPPISSKTTAGVKQRRRESSIGGGGGLGGGKRISRLHDTSQLPKLAQFSDQEKQYDCSVDKLCFLNARPTAYNTATLVSGGSYSMIRAWSCQGGGMLGQFQVLNNATLNDSIHAITTNAKNTLLITGDTMGYCTVYDISRYCFTMTTAHRYPPNVVHKQRAPCVEPPPLKVQFRAHLTTITNVELVPDQNIVISSSTDCSIRLWTVNGSYIGTFGQSDPWQIRPNSADDVNFILPDDIRATMTEDQINRSRRKKRKFNPWKSIKNIMTFTHINPHSLISGTHDNVDERLENDAAFRLVLDCDKSNILGRAYHRTTRPRRPMRSVTIGQECGSILAYSMLEKQRVKPDPGLPDPPTHMKVYGRDGLPKFNAQSLDKVAEEQQKLANSRWKTVEDEATSEDDIEYFVTRSKKYNEKNLFPAGVLPVTKIQTIKRPEKIPADIKKHQDPESFLRNILNVKKAVKRFGGKKNVPELLPNINIK